MNGWPDENQLIDAVRILQREVDGRRASERRGDDMGGGYPAIVEYCSNVLIIRERPGWFIARAVAALVIANVLVLCRERFRVVIPDGEIAVPAMQQQDGLSFPFNSKTKSNPIDDALVSLPH